MRNPYLAIHALGRARRPAAGVSGLLIQLVAAALAAPLAKPVLLGFLDGGAAPGAVPDGVEAVGFRLGALMVGAMSISTYSALVRGPDRPILDPHPVQPRLLLDALIAATARANLALPGMAALLLLPVGLAGHWTAWAGATALAFGAWICGLGLGFAGSLGGVWAAYSPGLAAVLDALRGANPRMQAALIYAPAVVLGVGGLASALAAAGLRAGLLGWAPGWAFLALPPVIGVVGLALARPLADVWYVRATALLAEIDGQWAGVENIAEQRTVYLEWAARGSRELTRALRQGWRRLRSWASGAWLLGGVGALAGWTASPDAADRVMVVGCGAVLLLGALPVRLAEGDPDWLDQALVVPRGAGEPCARRGGLALRARGRDPGDLRARPQAWARCGGPSLARARAARRRGRWPRRARRPPPGPSRRLALPARGRAAVGARDQHRLRRPSRRRPLRSPMPPTPATTRWLALTSRPSADILTDVQGTF